MDRGALTSPREHRRQARAEPDPIREPAQRVEARLSNHLPIAGFHPDVHHAVTVHFAGALLDCASDVSQQQEEQYQRALARMGDVSTPQSRE
jgi:hypothetical protein